MGSTGSVPSAGGKTGGPRLGLLASIAFAAMKSDPGSPPGEVQECVSVSYCS
jgi:hypothetical protein